MKKSVFVLAALGGIACAASAQSSVTLFGVIDANGRFLNNNGVKQYSLSQDGLQSSRLGFRGTEDLGGGLTAGFWIEGAINPDTGTPNGQTWQRRTTASLNSPWGELRLGRDKTATYLNTEVFDPFGDAGIGAASNLTTKAPPVPTGGGYSTEKRASNMIAYFIPSGVAGGLYGQAQVAAGERVNGQKYMGVRLGYASGPFDVALAYGQTEVLDTTGTNLDNFNIGGSWKFGFMILSGYYGSQEIENDKQDNWYIGVAAPFGLWRVRASYGQVERSGGSKIEGQKANQFAVGAVYDLSKRTALYGTWSGINNKGGAGFVVGSLNNYPGGGAAPNADSQGVEFGVRHAF
jgi:predicted porin